MAEPKKDKPKCRGCGKEIEWGETEQGKRVPLDPAPPCFRRDPSNPRKIIRVKDVMVSHFATCPDANKFSNRNGPHKGSSGSSTQRPPQNDAKKDEDIPY